MNIKALYGFTILWFVAASVCAAGCSLEDPCEPNETLSEDGKCIPIPTEPNDCGRSHYNCISYGVKTAVCEARTDVVDSQAAYRCVVSECEPGFHKSQNQNVALALVMPDACMPDSARECGESKQNCTASEGVAIAACESGVCAASACQMGFILTNRVCIKEIARSCGAEDNAKVDCIDAWLPQIYHNNETWVEASIPGCTANQCVISSCRNLTDENGGEIKFVKRSCAEVREPGFAEDYTAAYSNLRGASIELPDCADDDAHPKDIDVCLEDLCPDDDAKFMPGICGCGVYEDIADDDGDGVANCLDACPRNSTKSKDEGSGGCSANDSDHDGLDDTVDVCPTRDIVKTVEDLNNDAFMDTLKRMLLLDADGKPDADKIHALSEGERAQMCGILVNREFDGVDGFHIYNAKDIDYLRAVQRDIAQSDFCEDTYEACASRTNLGFKCVDGLRRSYICNGCTLSEEGKVRCSGDKSDLQELSPYLHIVLENDIDLDDSEDTLFYENGECIALWTPISYLWNMEFDGQNHTIRYTNPRLSDDSLRCNLTDAFFDSIKLSDVHDLTIDFNMHGNGHAVFANSIDRSTVKNIVMRSSYLQSNATDSNGIGIFAGNIILSEPGKLADITFDVPADQKIRVIAENANNVGGVLGKGTFKYAQDDSSQNKQMFGGVIRIETIRGNNRVGGIVGSGDFSQTMPLQIEIDSISGNDYVGGVLGDGEFVQTMPLQIEIDSISGNDFVGGVLGMGRIEQSQPLTLSVIRVQGYDYVGGVFGSLSSAEFWHSISGSAGDGHEYAVTSKVYSISGHSYIGGLTGYFESSSHNCGSFDSINNYVCSISASGDAVGGMYGHGLGLCLSANNYVKSIKGNRNVGGIIGDAESRTTNVRILFLDDVINVVENISGDYGCTGGVLGEYFAYGDIGLSHIYNQVGAIVIHANDRSRSGGVAGCISNGEYSIVPLETIYNMVDSVILDNAMFFGGMVGLFQYLIANTGSGADIGRVMERVGSYVKNVEFTDASSASIGGLFGKLDVTENSSVLLGTVSHVSSYMNYSSKAQSIGGVAPVVNAPNPRTGGYTFKVQNSVIGAADENNQCANVISSADFKNRFGFDNAFWFAPTRQFFHFGSGDNAEIGGLEAIDSSKDIVDYVANTIKVWEPAKEQIELGGKTYELPVVFTKEQFLQETGLTYDQSRYTDFDNWCRRVEQEHPELLDEIE